MDPANRGSFADAEAAALADLSAGRIVACDTVVRWLGGWPVAQALPRGDGPCDALAADRVDADGTVAGMPRSLVWTESAVRACHRLRLQLAGYGGGGDERLAAALVATMVTLTVEGADMAEGIASVPLLPPLMLHVTVERRRVGVLGLHWQGTIA